MTRSDQSDINRDELLAHAKNAITQGRMGDAKSLAQLVLDRHRNDFESCMVLAEVNARLGNLDRELSWVQRAVQSQPRNIRLRAHYGRRLFHAGELRRALRELESAHRKLPDDHAVTADLIATLEGLGREEAVERLLKPRLHQQTVAPEIAVVAMRWLLRKGDADRAIAIGTSLRTRTIEPPQLRRNLLFALSMALEHADRIDDAFAAAREANSVHPPPFDPSLFTKEIDRLCATVTRDFLNAIPVPPEASDLPAFIVGMPRTGSTLVERMLHAHPDIYGAGECGTVNGLLDEHDRVHAPQCLQEYPSERVAEVQSRYLNVLRDIAPKASRVINKELFNFWHLGMIDRTMPGARIIICRRDPMDCGLSCYMTNLPGDTVPFAFDLTHIGTVQRGVSRLLEHWCSVIDLPVHETEYERLVTDPASEAAALADFLDVPFDEAMLRTSSVRRAETTASRDQVRSDIHRNSIGRAERFAEHLEPLARALAGP